MLCVCFVVLFWIQLGNRKRTVAEPASVAHLYEVSLESCWPLEVAPKYLRDALCDYARSTCPSVYIPPSGMSSCVTYGRLDTHVPEGDLACTCVLLFYFRGCTAQLCNNLVGLLAYLALTNSAHIAGLPGRTKSECVSESL